MPPRPAPEQMLIHFYRAVVGHADVWRQRMDATTNWAAATTAAMITVTFSAASPHFVLLLVLVFDSMFLLMEARRFQTYDLWRRRFHTLNRYVVAPTLSESAAPSAAASREALHDLALDLGRTAPRLSLLRAVGYRVYRNYGYLYLVVFLAWLLKLSVHPEEAGGIGDVVAHAGIAGIPGAVVFTTVCGFLLLVLVLAASAPSQTMVNWTERPSLLGRWLRRGRRPTPLEDDPLSGVDA